MFDNQETVQVSVPVLYIKDFKGNRIPTCETYTEMCKFLMYSYSDGYSDTYITCNYTECGLVYKWLGTKSNVYNEKELKKLLKVEKVKELSDPKYLNDGIHHCESETAVIKILEPCKECPVHNNRLGTFW